MREFSDHFEEEYLYLADLTHDAALVAWGKFFFNSKMKLIKDKKIHMFQGQAGRHTSIGANCESYGRVTVEVIDGAGNVAQRVQTEETFAWVRGLRPDTSYAYRVLVREADGTERPWAAGRLAFYHEEEKELVETARTYSAGFRTFPDPASSAPLTFAVIGDTGTGTADQEDVARALERVAAERDIRLVIMVGDTIYARSGGSGDDDFEWLTTYFQPYRFIIDHIPFFPCMGNHDTNENFSFLGIGAAEKQQDRLNLYDNLLVFPRFVSERPAGREASVTPGLFYRFTFGRDVEFICLDTSKEKEVTDKRMFEFAAHRDWLEQALGTPLGSPAWRIPFSHHPPYCKGPQHDEDETSLRHDVIRRCGQHGVKAFLSGHEHNFQCIDSPDLPQVRCFVTGGGGGFREAKPTRETDGFLHAWGGNASPHFLIVTLDGATMTVEPIDGNGQPLQLFDVLGKPRPSVPITV